MFVVLKVDFRPPSEYLPHYQNLPFFIGLFFAYQEEML
jgi:hypothetical protein